MPKLEVQVTLKSGRQFDADLETSKEAAEMTDAETAKVIRDLVTTYHPNGWMAMGDTVCHINAIESIVPL